MGVSDGFMEYVVDQFSVFGEVTSRKMFGGAGIYHEGLFFALVAEDVLYLKVDDGNRADFEDLGLGPFHPYEKKDVTMSYYEVSAEILDDPHELADWARKAYDVARRAQGAKRGKK